MNNAKKLFNKVVIRRRETEHPYITVFITEPVKGSVGVYRYHLLQLFFCTMDRTCKRVMNAFYSVQEGAIHDHQLKVTTTKEVKMTDDIKIKRLYTYEDLKVHDDWVKKILSEIKPSVLENAEIGAATFPLDMGYFFHFNGIKLAA